MTCKVHINQISVKIVRECGHFNPYRILTAKDWI